MHWFVTSLRENPELAIFLTLAARLRDRPGPDRELPSRQRGGDAPRRRPRRPARREDRPAGEDGLLRPLPLRHRLQGRAAVLPRAAEERGVPGAADARAVRREPGDDGRGREGHGVRRRHRGRAPRRGVHRVHGHRHRRQHDLAPRAARGRDDPPPEQHPRRLRGQLPRGDELRGLVPLEPGAAAAARGPEGGEPQARGAVGVEGGDRDTRPPTASGTCGPSASRRRGPDAAWRTSRARFAPARVFFGRVRRERASSTSLRTPSSSPATSRWSGRAGTCSSPRGVPSARRSRTASCSTSRWRRSTSSSPGRSSPSGRSRRSPRSTAAASSSSSSSAAGEEIPFAPGTVINRGDLLRLAGDRARRRAGREGARLRRAAVERDGRGVRGPRDPARRAVRRAHPADRRSPDQPHRERRRAHHGARVRLAALGAPDVRAHPGARAVDLRHDRPRRLHRLRGPRRRPELRRRPAHDRAGPRRREPARGPDAPRSRRSSSGATSSR